MVEFLRTFRIANIEIRQADAPFTAGGKTYPAGTYVIGPQSFRPYVVDLIEREEVPGAAPLSGRPARSAVRHDRLRARATRWA